MRNEYGGALEPLSGGRTPRSGGVRERQQLWSRRRLSRDRGSQPRWRRGGFAQLGFAPRVVSEVDSDTVITEFRRKHEQPTIFVYSGHGGLVHGSVPRDEEPVTPERPLIPSCPDEGPRCTSLVCLSDGWHVVDQLIEHLNGETPFALLVLEACTAADVDPRVAHTEVAVLSLTRERMAIVPNQVRDTSERHKAGMTTLLGTAMAELVRHGIADLDCDGAIDELEFSEAVAARLKRGTTADALPTLRSQTRDRHRLVRTRATACVPRTTSIALDDEPYSIEGREFVRLHGFIAQTRTAPLFRGAVAVSQLAPVACQDFEGQCFRTLEARRR
jgi:hypothetical protein